MSYIHECVCGKIGGKLINQNTDNGIYQNLPFLHIYIYIYIRKSDSSQPPEVQNWNHTIVKPRTHFGGFLWEIFILIIIIIIILKEFSGILRYKQIT